MTTTIISVNGRYRYKIDLVWKNMPVTRSYDILGIGIDSTVSGISTTKYFQQTIDWDNSAGGYCYTTTSTSGTWKLAGTGYAITFKLPDNKTNEKVYGLKSYMYFEVQKLASPTIYTLNAYGDYAHAQKTVQSSVSNGVSIGTGGISFDASVSYSIVESYDAINTAQATWSGLSW